MDKKERYERYKYLTGLSAWEIASFLDKDNVAVLNDGPSGLRKPLNNAFTCQQDLIQTVCLPTPSALAASFDYETVYKASSIIAQECLRHGTNILLAPGINIKKYVLCGRNFEYFSEDPYLAGYLAAGYVNGLEDNGVGACLKHYACNSQEFARTINSSQVSLRALNEIYLRAFNYALKYSHPTAVMTSYNRINGEYVSESDYLINKKLRNEFNFKGLIMSDWCGVSDKGKSIKTGLNIEMPLSKMSYEYVDKEYLNVFNDEDLINRDKELFESIKKFKNSKKLNSLDLDELHNAAIDIANKTVVLAKNNDNYFPIREDEKVLVLGYFANHPRFVGNGSGFVYAYKSESFIDVLKRNNIQYEFIECFDEEKCNISLNDLLPLKNKYNKVVLFLGQYQFDESEGIDRESIDLRKQQLDTLEIVKNVFDKFAVVLNSGSVVNVKDIYANASSFMISYLAGEGYAEAIYNNVFGKHNPSGRLPETWISDVKQNKHNLEHLKHNVYSTLYTDDIYVGYRYYDSHSDGFLLPFGYGLSYSSFSYKRFEISKNKDQITISLIVKNESNIPGEDVIQIYVGRDKTNIYRPKKELKAFKKIYLESQEEKQISIDIDIDNLNCYRDSTDQLELEDGEYLFYIAKNTQEIIKTLSISLDGSIFELTYFPDKVVDFVPNNKLDLNSPAAVLLNNDNFKKYVKEHHLNIDLDNFDSKYSYIANKALRVTIGDEDLKISFAEMENLIDFLNSGREEAR